MMNKTQRRIARRELRNRDGDLCHWCNRLLKFAKRERLGVREPDNWATIEHIVPISHGGSDDLSNLALACKRCNSSRAYNGLPTLELTRAMMLQKVAA